MISVDDLPEWSRGEVVQLDGKSLSEVEEAQLEFIDAKLGEAASVLKGEMFAPTISRKFASKLVISALKMLWETGGWIVGVFPAEDGWQMVFVRPRAGVFNKKVKSALQARTAVELDDAPIQKEKNTRDSNVSCPLLVRMPTRGRPQQAMEVLSAYRRLATSHVKIEIVVDEDDASMAAPEVLQRLSDLDVVLTVGRHKSKIEAVNGGRVDDWAILALASDDMMPIVEGYDRRIVEEMDIAFPLRDGAIYFNDGYNKEHVRDGQTVLCTMPIMGRHLWEQFGYVYEPGYGSLFSDDEQTRILTAMRRLKFVDEVIIEHRHHAAGKAPHDTLYQFNDSKWGAIDKAYFENRSHLQQPGSQFMFDAPQLVLSILICTIPVRASMFCRLVDYLRAQMRRFPRQIEIVVDDRVGVTVGEKRQALLERAVGTYVAFIDDDDWVAADYCARLMNTVTTVPGIDCVSLVGAMTVDGGNVQRFEHSIENSKWSTRADGVHLRCPNHLNTIRRELALQVGFVSKNVGEDHDFSTRLLPLLKREASIGDAVIYHYFYRPQQSVQRKGA